MTVEQSPAPRLNQAKSRGEEVIYAQIKEVTGITNDKVIGEAIQACRNGGGKYEIADVVNMLINDEPLKKAEAQAAKQQKMAITHPRTVDDTDANASSDPKKENNKDKNVIDLTTEGPETSDIQKAIAASLQESVTSDTPGILGGQVSREEQDISRILEQSLIESKAGTKRKRGDIWFVDPLNPHERKRIDNWPVGLKNVGNTCWFSAVIQSLFQLRRFRHLVLSYQPPKDVSQGNTAEKRNLRFMQELRHLFALMVGSRKKYVDPSRAVDILKEAFATTSVNTTGMTDSQQDVSEFQHKLLEWLEDAFRNRSRPGTPTESASPSTSGSTEETEPASLKYNPMTELFYGQYRAEGMNEGKVFSNEENFGQFPLQVNGFTDIHESLEAATAQGEIETVSSESMHKSGQELWFTRLPPVLTFELSRFQFNQTLGRPEKIHNKIEFPQIIYVDRYLDCNKLETRQRREKTKTLKEELIALQARLDKFINYGSGPKRFPLHDVLQYALEFAKTKVESSSSCTELNVSQDVEMESPGPHTSMLTDSPVKSPNVPDIPQPNLPKLSPLRPHRTMAVVSSPSPKDVSDSELKVLENCLHRWRTEVESDVRALQENIGALEESINKMYSDDAMKKCPYHLHAVLVHEGQAASGHYWAYIFDALKERWLKYNDITVSEASWEELEKECVGGYHNASAYCLMYIDKNRVVDRSGAGDKACHSAEPDNLPDDLKEVVAMDNKAFEEEIEKWDREQARKAAGGGDADVTVISEQEAGHSNNHVGTQTVQSTMSQRASLSSSHAHLSFHFSLKALNAILDSDVLETKGADSAVQHLYAYEIKRLQEVLVTISRDLLKRDARLQHIMLYILYNNCNRKFTVQRIMLEQFTDITVLDSNERAKKIRTVALKMIEKFRKEDGEDGEKHYQFWHDKYNMFRRMAHLFIHGLELYFGERYELSLPYLIHAYSFNTSLLKDLENGGYSDHIIAFFVRQCLLHINDTATFNFEEQYDVSEPLQVMNNLVLPCLPVMLQTGYHEDTAAAEEIREKWCAFLGQEMEAVKVDKLQDFLAKLFDPPSDIKIPKIPSFRHVDFSMLYKQYVDVMKIAKESGCLDRAVKAS